MMNNSHDFQEEKVSICALFNLAVMLMGSLVYGIRYTFPEYFCTFLVAGGVSAFALMKVGISLCHDVKLLFLFFFSFIFSMLSNQ